jgi:hypothetical protein
MIGAGIYLVATVLFYGFLLATAKPETSKALQN